MNDPCVIMMKCVIADCVFSYCSDTGLHPQHGNDPGQDGRGDRRGEPVGMRSIVSAHEPYSNLITSCNVVYCGSWSCFVF